MPNVRTLQRSFSGGEVSPEFRGRPDDPKYQTGLAKCVNFIVTPHGPLRNRPGTQFVRAAKSTSARLIPFQFSATQTLVIEMSVGAFRFHTLGGTVMNGAVPYEVAHSYSAANIAAVQYVQSNDILTLTLPGSRATELRRLGATNWTWTTQLFGRDVTAPTSPSVAATFPSGGAAYTYSYAICAIGANGVSESSAATTAGAANNLTVAGNFNTVTWAAAAGATGYNVYRQFGGAAYFIGATTGTNFVDTNVSPDLARPLRGPGSIQFASVGPLTTCYFEQRRWLGGQPSNPQRIWATRSGTETDLSTSLPSRADDALDFSIASREANSVLHLVPLSTGVLVFTAGAEYLVRSADGGAITPATISAKPQSAIGASSLRPVAVGNTVLFVGRQGQHVREIGYSNEAEGFVSGDLSLRAAHLFDGWTLVDAAYQKAPHPVVWFIANRTVNGKLENVILGLTYIPEQKVWAWHQHDFSQGTSVEGSAVSMAVVSEGSVEAVYLLVTRGTSLYVERMVDSRVEGGPDWFVDSGLSLVSATPVSTLSGLGHLEGRTVAVLADGMVQAKKVVTGGSITLDVPAKVIVVGLSYFSEMTTLPLALEAAEAAGVPFVKNVNRAFIRVADTRGLFVGPADGELTENVPRYAEGINAAPGRRTGVLEVVVEPDWQADAQITIRQNDPLPATVVGLALEVAIGG